MERLLTMFANKSLSKGLFKGLFKSLPMNRKAQSVAFSWVFGLVSLFGIGILYIVFNQVFSDNLVPLIKDMNTNSSVDAQTKADVVTGIDRYMTYFNLLPFILFGVVVLYMFVAAVRRERDEGF